MSQGKIALVGDKDLKSMMWPQDVTGWIDAGCMLLWRWRRQVLLYEGDGSQDSRDKGLCRLRLRWENFYLVPWKRGQLLIYSGWILRIRGFEAGGLYESGDMDAITALCSSSGGIDTGLRSTVLSATAGHGNRYPSKDHPYVMVSTCC